MRDDRLTLTMVGISILTYRSLLKAKVCYSLSITNTIWSLPKSVFNTIQHLPPIFKLSSLISGIMKPFLIFNYLMPLNSKILTSSVYVEYSLATVISSCCSRSRFNEDLLKEKALKAFRDSRKEWLKKGYLLKTNFIQENNHYLCFELNFFRCLQWSFSKTSTTSYFDKRRVKFIMSLQMFSFVQLSRQHR